jgi:hypothetical protein
MPATAVSWMDSVNVAVFPDMLPEALNTTPSGFVPEIVTVLPEGMVPPTMANINVRPFSFCDSLTKVSTPVGAIWTTE